MMLEHVNCLQRPVMPSEMEVPVDISAVLPICGETSDPFVNGAFFDPETRVRSQLQIERITRARDIMRSISEGNLDHMQHNIRTSLHMKPKIMKCLPSPLPAIGI